MNHYKWLRVVGYLALAALAFAAFGLIAFKLIGVAGVVGVVIVAIAILVNGFLAKVEDDLPGGFNDPHSPPVNKVRK